MAPRLSPLLLVALLAPVAAGAETWILEPQKLTLRSGYKSTVSAATVSGTLVLDSNREKDKLSLTFHGFVDAPPLENGEPPRPKAENPPGEASFETRELSPNNPLSFTGTFRAKGPPGPALYSLSMETPVENSETGRLSCEAFFSSNSPDRPSFSAKLVRQTAAEELLQQTAGEKSSGKGPWGVLLGIASRGSPSTYFVDASGVTRLGIGLAVPRRTGWWFVDADEDTLVAAPEGKVSRKDFASTDDENCADGMRGGYTMHLLYVGPELLSLEQVNHREYCGSPMHESSRRLITLRLTRTSGPVLGEPELPIEDVLGPESKAPFEAAVSTACSYSRCTEDERANLFTTWGLTPLRLFAAIPVGHSDESDYIPEPLPAKLLAALKRPARHFVADEQHPLPPLGPEAKEPGPASASVTAPDGSFELRLYPSGILVWAGNKLVGSIPGANQQLVMEEWASGEANLIRWRKQASEVLANVHR